MILSSCSSFLSLSVCALGLCFPAIGQANCIDFKAGLSTVASYFGSSFADSTLSLEPLDFLTTSIEINYGSNGSSFRYYAGTWLNPNYLKSKNGPLGQTLGIDYLLFSSDTCVDSERSRSFLRAGFENLMLKSKKLSSEDPDQVHDGIGVRFGIGKRKGSFSYELHTVIIPFAVVNGPFQGVWVLPTLSFVLDP